MNQSGEIKRAWMCRAPLVAALTTFLMGMAFCGWATAQTTRPNAAGALEGQPLRRPTANSPATTRSSLGEIAPRSGGLVDLPRVALSLAAVLTLIFAVRWAGKWFFPGMRAFRGAGAVQVLGRSPVTAKQQVLLLHVGRRVLVVADNGVQMNSLSEITDPNEVAQLVGQLTASPSAAKDGFEHEFGKAKEGFERMETSPQQEAMPDPDAAEIPRPEDESVQAAHGEIKGLVDKVRMLAKEIGRS